MQTENLPSLIPYIVSFLLSAGISLYAWRQRQVAGALPYALLTGARAWWTAGYIFELLARSLSRKIFWDNTQWVGAAVIPVAFLAFSLQFTGRRLSNPVTVRRLLTVITILIVVVPFTDNVHHLIHPDARLVPDAPFDVLVYDYTPGVWLIFLYSAVVSFASIYILITHYQVQISYFYRNQVLLVIIGSLLPLIGVTLTIVGVKLGAQRDTTPFTFAIGNLVVAWGLFRFGFLDIVPIARAHVLESMSDMVLVVDSENRLVDMNAAARRTIQPGREVIGLPIAEVLAPWADLFQQYRDIENTHTEIVVGEGIEKRYFDLRISPLITGKNQVSGRVVMIRDITAYKTIQIELQQRTGQLEAAYERLSALSRVKDEFVSNVSHELRTPISSLKLNEELLRRKPENAALYVARIQRETQRLEHLIEDLLHLSRLDQGRTSAAPALNDLNTLCQSYTNDRQVLAENKNIQLVYEGAVNLPEVTFDAGLIGQALSILLTNAINYTPSGGRIAVSTGLQQTNGAQWIGLSVRDNGPGIAPDEQEQLFTRFFRGTAGLESGVPGTGLGLAIAWEIVQQHEGRLEVESTGIAGEGASFNLWLPVHHDAA